MGETNMSARSKLFLIFLAVLMIGVLAACSSEEPTPEAVPASTTQQPQVVSAEAFVFPVRETTLSFEVGGRVALVAVEEGDTVKEGDVLAQLENSSQQAGLTEAKAGLLQAEANLTQATAQLSEAEASLADVKADPTPEEIAQYKAILAKAQAGLADMLAGATPEEVGEAQAGVNTAQAQLNEVLADARNEDLQAASARMLQAEADVREAQSTYDKVRYGDPDDVLKSGVVLEKATLVYEAAKAEYEKLVNGATDEQVAVAQAQVAEARAALARVGAGATAEEIAAAQADVAKAQADLDQLLAGATDQQVAIAEAQVDTAQAGTKTAEASVEAAKAQVQSAQADLDKTVLKAPFSGQIGSLNEVDEGEIISAGTNVVSLGDTSVWQIKTDDLTEIDIVDVRVGAKVDISVDALPGETFEGTVSKITPKSETKAGDVTYTVTIDLTKGDTSKLRWGMTTFVDIEVGPEI
ncbi:MAG TPA: HlyD family efflux transporter periplasmic adaptor subunit [Anaerolineae bacterium]|nr:HlyD family efflux transporter periplasmic adaptor subunit [Anaerolineae bacterium]HMR64590.1 HlyD family efflux transporter periplasmic adaptor subunit [Anaerolineae bacterium]